MMNAASTIPSSLSSAEVGELVGDRLRNYVKGCTSPFTCGGSLTLDSPPAVALVGEDGSKGEPIAIQVPSELRPGGALRPSDYEKKPSRIHFSGCNNRYEKSEKVTKCMCTTCAT